MPAKTLMSQMKTTPCVVCRISIMHYLQSPKRQWPERLVYVKVFFSRAYMHFSVCILRQKKLRIINLNQPSFFSHLAMATTRLSEARCNSEIKLHHDCGPTRACWNDRRLFVWSHLWGLLYLGYVNLFQKVRMVFWLDKTSSKSNQFSKKLFRVSIGVYA